MIIDVDTHWEATTYAGGEHPLEPWLAQLPTGLSMLADINQARPPVEGENATATLAARRPIQGFGTISAVLPAVSTIRSVVTVELPCD